MFSEATSSQSECKKWTVDAGGTELEAGRGSREVSSADGSSRWLWGLGRWLRRGGLGDPERLAWF